MRQLSPAQWKAGVAAWLGWLFDGLDMHLYTLVAAPFVASLLHVPERAPEVATHSAWIQAAFLLGWAVGGGVFGRVGDLLGRTRTLNLTILTYALFTGVSFWAQTWWQLLIFRFLAALGIGGEWAVGASLLAETWPRRWRPWLSAVLQSGVNLGILLAGAVNYVLAPYPSRYVFLAGIAPAFLVLWIRRAVPETAAWSAAHQVEAAPAPWIGLFRGPVRRVTWLSLLVCACGLSGHWAFVFWYPQHLRRLPEVATWSDRAVTELVSREFMVLMAASIAGNFMAGGVAKIVGFRRAIVGLFFVYFAAMVGAYCVPRDLRSLQLWLPWLGLSSGVFALFTMYLPPLFPVLLRTTGAGFCYNFGRVAAAAGTVCFGLMSPVGDHRLALLSAGCLFLPAGLFALYLPEAEPVPVEACAPGVSLPELATETSNPTTAVD